MKHHLRLYALFAFFAIARPAPGAEPSNSDICAVQALVRAPNLDPGEIIQGQVRIQTKGSCDTISEYSLILRFKERVWAKILNPDVALPEKPGQRYLNNGSNLRTERNSVLGTSFHSDLFSPTPLWREYIQEMRSPALWIIAEEERVAFESKYKLFEGTIPQIRSIHDFALLVPTTNYPPSPFHRVHGTFSSREPISERGNEHIYLYTVAVRFTNGTTIEVPAGYSSFNTVGLDSQDNAPEVVSFTANFTEINQLTLDPPLDPLNVTFDINVTFPHGRHMEQGSVHNLSFMSCGEPRTSSNREANYTFRPPYLSLRRTTHERRMQTLFPEINISAPILSTNILQCQLFPTSSDSESTDICYDRNILKHVEKPNWNKTTLEPLGITKAAFPSFDMYYQSIEAEVTIMLSLQYELNQETDEDYEWIPTIQTQEKTKFFKAFSKKIPVTISPRKKQGIHITHYLSPDARQPVFFDPSTATRLSQLSVEERDLLAPKSKAAINKGADDVVRNRYNHYGLHYVGDTWQRKVLNSPSKALHGKDGASALLVQAV